MAALTMVNVNNNNGESHKSARDRYDERVRAIIDPYPLALMTDTCDGDGEVLKVENLLDGLVFDMADVPYKIKWADIDKLERELMGELINVLEPRLFNNAAFRHMLRPFLSRALVLLRRCGLFAYWCLQKPKMAIWWKAYLKADADGKSQIPAPFGIIEPTAAIFSECHIPASELEGIGPGLPMSRLEVEWVPLESPAEQERRRNHDTPLIPANVHVTVYRDRQVTLQYASAGSVLQYRQRAMTLGSRAPVFALARERYGWSSETGAPTGFGQEGSTPLMMPASSMWDVMRLKARLVEAITNQQNAEGIIVQPNIIVHSKEVRVDPNAVQRAADNILGVNENAVDLMLLEVNQKQQYSAEQWEYFHTVLQQGIGKYAGSPDAPSVSEMVRSLFNRPHPRESMERVPQDFQLAHVHEPKTLVDVPALEEQYRRAVAESLGVGTWVFDQLLSAGRTGSSAGASKGGGGGSFAALHSVGQQTPAERELLRVVQTNRNRVVDVFSNVFAKCMNGLAMDMVEDLHAALHDITLNVKEARLAAKALKKALRREMDAEMDLQLSATGTSSSSSSSSTESNTETLKADYKAAKKNAGSRKDRRSIRVTQQQVRQWYSALCYRTDAMAVLEFLPGTTERTTRQLEVLLEAFFDRGLIKPKTLVPFVKDVFGEKVKLVNDPVPPLLPGTALSPGEELAAETAIETAELQADTATETTQMQGEQKMDQEQLKAANKPAPAAAKPKPAAKKKAPAAAAPKKKSATKKKAPKKKKRLLDKSSDDDDDDDSNDSSDSSSSSDNEKKKKKKKNSSSKKRKRDDSSDSDNSDASDDDSDSDSESTRARKKKRKQKKRARTGSD